MYKIFCVTTPYNLKNLNDSFESKKNKTIFQALMNLWGSQEMISPSPKSQSEHKSIPFKSLQIF